MAEEIAEKGDAPICSERYVAFVDILGFSNIVRNSVDSPHQAGKLARILQRLANSKAKAMTSAANHSRIASSYPRTRRRRDCSTNCRR